MNGELKKQQVGTSLDTQDVARIEVLASRESTSEAHILRKCVLAGLPEIERQILGPQFAGGKAVRRKAA